MSMSSDTKVTQTCCLFTKYFSGAILINNTNTLIKMTDLSTIVTIKCKQQVVRAVRFNIDGTYCLTCGADKKIKLWNPHRQLLLKTYGGHANEVLEAAGSCDSSHIVSCSADKSVILWDVTTGQPIRRYRGHASSVTCVKFNEESSMAVSGSVDNTVAFWDIISRRQEPIQVLKDAKDTITSIQVTDHEIMTCSVDSHVRLYDIRVGKMFSDYIGNIITYGSMTHDGQCYVLSCNDGTIKLFDKDSGELLNTFTGHDCKDYMLENAVNEKDSHIISGSATGEILFWDLISSTCTNKLVHNVNKPVVSLSHHPTDNYLLTACDDEIKLWGTKSIEE
jgi:mitogen-activated protein kinase organizer 1